MSGRVECGLLDSNPVNSRLCAVWLNGSVRIGDSRLKCPCFLSCLFIRLPIAASLKTKTTYAGTYLSYSGVHSMDIVVFADGPNVQLGYLAQTEWNMGGRIPVPADCTDNRDRLIQVCSDHRLFSVNTNFVISRKIS